MADETQNMNDVTDEHEVAPQVKPLFPLRRPAPGCDR